MVPLSTYDFGKDEIEIDWTYEYYGSIVDKDKKIIRGIAICEKCNEDTFDVVIWLNEKNKPIVVDQIIKLNEMDKKNI